MHFQYEYQIVRHFFLILLKSGYFSHNPLFITKIFFKMIFFKGKPEGSFYVDFVA